jgi:hypothetical protein
MPETIALAEVGFIKGDTIESVSYQSCDFCFGSVVEDIWAKREPRKFYQQLGGVNHSLVACEKCLDEYLAEQPE